MKKLILIFSMCCLVAGTVFGQCTNTSVYGSATINTSGTITTISQFSYAGEYSTISGALAGQVLKFTSSISTDYITVHSGSPAGPVVAFGQTPVSFTNAVAGTLYAHWNASATCATQSSSRTTTVQCVSCAPAPPVDPCTAIGSIACGVTQAVSLTGSGGNWNNNACGFSTPGAEKVFTFTAPTTGIYTLNVSGGSGGFIDWMFKPTSGGCGQTGWTCIDDLSTSGSATFNLTAGTYYILADAEGTSTRSQNFNIDCTQPIDPCASALSSACGTSQTITLVGTGSGWSSGACYSTPGAEQVYTFTAPSSGTYTLNVSNGTGGYIDYLYKPVSAGCGPTGWTCIDDIFSSGTVNFTLAAGDYYILLDGEGTSSRTQTWDITCPSPAPVNDDCAGAINISCGQSIVGSTLNASPDAVQACNGFSVGTGGGLWYKYVGTGSLVTVSLCSPNTTYDTKLHIYEGNCTNPMCVTADDDGCDSPTLASEATFCAAAGTTYYILVNGYLSAAGQFELSVSCTGNVTISSVSDRCQSGAIATLTGTPAGGVFSGPGVVGNTFNPALAGGGSHTITYTYCNASASTVANVTATPANDLVANAESMTCGSTVSGSTSCATSETLGTCGTTDGSGGGVWYAMPGTGNRITLTTCSAGTNFDTKIRVFDGTPSALNCVTGNDDDSNCSTGPGTPSFKSTVSFCSTPGVTYYILVHGFSSSTGDFTLVSTCDPVAPSITCAGPLAGNLDGNCTFLVPDYTGLTSATDDCGNVTITQSPAAGSTLTGAGSYTVTFTATDLGGNATSCSSELTLTDITAPIAVCQPVTVQLDANGNGNTSASAVNNGSSDACGVASLALDNDAFTCSNVGSQNVVTLTVTDVNGLSATCTSVVTVEDNVAPVINCPADIFVTAPQGQCNTTVTYEVTASDACGASVTSVSPVSGSLFGLGNTTVDAVATDVNGNTSACSFVVNVAGDGILTLWGVPCDVTKRCDQIPAAPAIVACPSNGNGGSGSGSGHHGSGNHGSGHVCNYGTGGSGSGHQGNYAGYNGYTSNPCGNGGSGSGSGHHGSGHNNNNCNVYCVTNSCGVYATSLCGPCPTVTYSETTVPGSCANNYQLIRTWTATDATGNTLSQSQTISVYDDVRPSINCPSNMNVCIPQNRSSKVVNFNIGATDNCGTPTVVATPASGSNFQLGNTYVTAVASDACGNTRSCTFRVRVYRGNCGGGSGSNNKVAHDPSAAGNSDLAPSMDMRAFPNPTNGMVDVEIACQNCSQDQTYTLNVTDLYGKVMMKKEVEITGGQANLKLDLSQFASGVYMISVNNVTTRIMKQ